MTKDYSSNLLQSYDCAVLQPEQKRAKISDGLYNNWLPMKSIESTNDDASPSAASHIKFQMHNTNAHSQAYMNMFDLLQKNSQQRYSR